MADLAELERQYFARGKEICGPAAGGLLARLLKAKNGNVALARGEVERASQKENPREWLAKVARPKASGAIGNGAAAAWDLKAKAQLDERRAIRPPTDEERAAVAAKHAAFRQRAPADNAPLPFATGQPAAHGRRVTTELARRNLLRGLEA